MFIIARLSASGLNGRYRSALGHIIGGHCSFCPLGKLVTGFVAYSVFSPSAVAVEITSIHRGVWQYG